MSVIIARCSLDGLFAGEPIIIASDGPQIQGTLHLPGIPAPHRSFTHNALSSWYA